MTHALLSVPTILPTFFVKNPPGKKDECINTYEVFSKNAHDHCKKYCNHLKLVCREKKNSYFYLVSSALHSTKDIQDGVLI